MQRLFPCLLFAAAGALAQSFEISVSGGVSRLYNPSLGVLVDPSGNNAFSLKDGWRIGFRTTLNNWRYFAHEFGYGYNRTQLRNETTDMEGGMAIHQGFYSFLAYAVKDGSKVRPFVTGGAHFNNYVPPGFSVSSGGGSSKLGYNYGAGIKVRLNPIFAIRFDVRQYLNGKPFSFLQNRSGLLRQTEVSMGFGLVI